MEGGNLSFIELYMTLIFGLLPVFLGSGSNIREASKARQFLN